MKNVLQMQDAYLAIEKMAVNRAGTEWDKAYQDFLNALKEEIFIEFNSRQEVSCE